MSTSETRAAAAVATLLLMTAPALAEPEFGEPVNEEALAAWDISIPPSGEGLPEGGGTALDGAAVWAEKCAACHGADGEGVGRLGPVVGGIGSLATGQPLKTVGSYWPYATTLFDYTRRAMPLDAPQSLTDNEVYAVSAFILARNGLIAEDAELDARTLPEVEMPNRDGFVSWWPLPGGE
jgi:S-disulfanyl-L-cysteine oxidoreductase SoxD